MTNQLTIDFCDALKGVDGRKSRIKRQLIDSTRCAITLDEAATAYKLILSSDWMTVSVTMRSRQWNLLELDYLYIAERFWKMWRRKASEYDITYVQTVSWTELPNRQRSEQWTHMNIFIGDTPARLRSVYWSPSRYSAPGLVVSLIQFFQEDKSSILNFLRHYATLDSHEARISVRIYGRYANFQRISEYRPYFDYLHAGA